MIKIYFNNKDKELFYMIDTKNINTKDIFDINKIYFYDIQNILDKIYSLYEKDFYNDIYINNKNITDYIIFENENIYKNENEIIKYIISKLNEYNIELKIKYIKSDIIDMINNNKLKNKYIDNINILVNNMKDTKENKIILYNELKNIKNEIKKKYNIK